MKSLIEHYGLETCFLIAFLFLIWIGTRSQKDFWKHLFYNLGALFIALSIYEFFLTFRALPNTTIIKDFEYFQPDSLLGYSAIGPQAYEVNVLKKFTDTGDMVYQARYGLKNGYRKVPEADSVKANALFMGGSFIFGEGVNDHQTLPSCYAKLTDRTNVFNYGFHGYGPHQVLMQLRHRVFQNEDLLQVRKGYAYYLFIPPHISRAHGRTEWDKTGPYFYLEEDSLIWGGNFRDKRNNTALWTKLLQAVILKSRIYNLHFRAHVESGPDELNLVLALISEMKSIVEIHGFEFRVILEYQPVHKGLVENIKKGLNKVNVAYVDTNDAIADKTLDNRDLYIAGDLHPTPRFYRLLAEYLMLQNPAW